VISPVTSATSGSAGCTCPTTKGLRGQTKESDFALPQTETLRFVFPPQRGVVVKWIDLKPKGSAPPIRTDAEPDLKPAPQETDPGNPNDKDDQ
jgi:hypothetical protein